MHADSDGLVARCIMQPPFLHSTTADICNAMNLPCPALHTAHLEPRTAARDEACNTDVVLCGLQLAGL